MNSSAQQLFSIFLFTKSFTTVRDRRCPHLGGGRAGVSGRCGGSGATWRPSRTVALVTSCRVRAAPATVLAAAHRCAGAQVNVCTGAGWSQDPPGPPQGWMSRVVFLLEDAGPAAGRPSDVTASDREGRGAGGWRGGAIWRRDQRTCRPLRGGRWHPRAPVHCDSARLESEWEAGLGGACGANSDAPLG